MYQVFLCLQDYYGDGSRQAYRVYSKCCRYYRPMSFSVYCIPVFTVTDKNSLTSIGDNLFAIEEGTDLYMGSLSDGLGRIRQGFLEESNVDLTEELVDMLTTQRAYQLNTRSITVADEMWGMTNNLRR